MPNQVEYPIVTSEWNRLSRQCQGVAVILWSVILESERAMDAYSLRDFGEVNRATRSVLSSLGLEQVKQWMPAGDRRRIAQFVEDAKQSLASGDKDALLDALEDFNQAVAAASFDTVVRCECPQRK